ncbi:uncharacterized protein LOC123532954 [Mercenaria mercenaria]|uniref:uncharacterized protein LOC123532954 n=1 Tax=Mercenaria mercenaria TaxID=6596 RepID=UPI00234F6B07|nr:uncharacterized protein LOC123532954 [Mercenaria mercenaria]XP_053373863.1 uncharacterized protein LOC123532954 [Mercenaria mercenaria]XP_053373864.1 uncharacterized protein LOC123532954 [Mercenaria mercenaria]XP_053373865.1 uncharacterized protein LOC123532954 [Mercenaria mercenaria]
MKTHKEVLDIVKTGIHEFIEIAVKQQHEQLLARLPDSTSSGFTRLEPCFECNRDNLKPRHSENACPSLNYCFCKNKRKEKRACPNRTCDYIYEGIIEDHVKYSPNLKTTDISQWTQNYWDIAKCYMEHSSQSAESTDILDLLHLISNNRFVIQKLLSNETVESAKTQKERLSEVRNILDKAIKICRRLKRTAGKCSSDDLKNICTILSKIGDQNSSKAVQNLHTIALDIDIERKESLSTSEMRDAVDKHFKSAENALSCRQTDATEDALKLTSLQLLFKQKLLVAETVQSFEDGQFVESSIVDILFGSTKHQTIFVSTENEDQRSTHWSEKEWFIYNVLKYHFNAKSEQEKDPDLYANLKEGCGYSDIIVVSKSVSDRMAVPYKTFCEGVLNDILPSHKNCLVILDFCDAEVKGVFKCAKKALQRHTVVKLIQSRDIHSLKSKRQLSTTYVKAEPVHELTIRNVCEDSKLGKETAGIIQQILFKTMRKIGDKNISSLTFENIRFDDISTKVKLSSISQLTSLKLIGCAFTPVNCKYLKSIDIISDEATISYFLDQVKLILYPAIQTCLGLQNITTSEIKLGDKSFCIKLSTTALESGAETYFGVTLRSCSRENVLELLDIETAKILMAAGCDIGDFELAKGREKTIILNSIKFGLLESDPNFVHVYPAECHLKTRKSTNIVFVCFMKENFDIGNECAFRQFRGFDTFLRSYNRVSSESFLAESAALEVGGANEVITEQIKKDIEETVALNSMALMNKHSNLEVVGVSLGKARDNTLDLCDGPYIVLYVRLRGFVPHGENLFPTKLTHPLNQTVEFKTDVREGYYIPLADNRVEYLHPEMKVPNLVMGCSIGFPNNDYAATIGPFVEIESGNDDAKMKETGFITACHLFNTPKNEQSVIGTQVVQPSDGDEPVVDVSTGKFELGISSDKVCGEVVACTYNEETDAALVKITKRSPRKGAFITCQRRDLKEAGFSRTIEYNDGSVSSLEAAFRRNVVKIGKTTKLTLGQCCLEETAVKISSESITATHPLTRERSSIIMKNLFFIGGFGNKSFSDDGDSGAGVFLVGENNRLSCIGMVIGKTTDGYCIAIPIQKILDRLSRTSYTNLDNLKVTMKTFDD